MSVSGSIEEELVEAFRLGLRLGSKKGAQERSVSDSITQERNPVLAAFDSSTLDGSSVLEASSSRTQECNPCDDVNPDDLAVVEHDDDGVLDAKPEEIERLMNNMQARRGPQQAAVDDWAVVGAMHPTADWRKPWPSVVCGPMLLTEEGVSTAPGTRFYTLWCIDGDTSLEGVHYGVGTMAYVGLMARAKGQFKSLAWQRVNTLTEAIEKFQARRGVVGRPLIYEWKTGRS